MVFYLAKDEIQPSIIHKINSIKMKDFHVKHKTLKHWLKKYSCMSFRHWGREIFLK